jgi:SAM-dependent methyltransferase
MGTARIQGDLWSVHAHTWADFQEGMNVPLYKCLFDRLPMHTSTCLLDIGCGAGLATLLATKLGAQVSGIDASAALIAIARLRMPQGDFSVGDMEELPYPDATFDIVTGFHALQCAADPIRALQQARRVMKATGQLALVTPGRAQDSEYATMLAALDALQPSTERGGPLAHPQPDQWEFFLKQAGLMTQESGEIPCAYEWPDEETAWKAIGSMGTTVATVRAVGEERVKRAIRDILMPCKTASGEYRQENSFRYVIATVA